MIMEEDDYRRHQERLDRIAKKGERMAVLTKFMARHMSKIVVTAITLTVGGILCFLWGYFSKLRSKE